MGGIWLPLLRAQRTLWRTPSSRLSYPLQQESSIVHQLRLLLKQHIGRRSTMGQHPAPPATPCPTPPSAALPYTESSRCFTARQCQGLGKSILGSHMSVIYKSIQFLNGINRRREICAGALLQHKDVFRAGHTSLPACPSNLHLQMLLSRVLLR